MNCSRRGFLAAAGVFAAGSLISTFAPAPIKAFAAPGSDVIPQPAIELRCNADGCFKIISFADLHGDADHLAPQVVQRIERLLDREQPDLVVLDGDNTWLMDNEDDLRGCVADIAAPMEDRGIPWAHVYGNHDAEGSAPDKASQHAIYTIHPHCVSQQGPGDIYGMENYVLPILAHDSDEIVFNIWCIDSGEYISGKLRNQLYPDQSMFRGLRNSHYAHVSPSVVNWYYQQSKAIEDELGRKVPGIMFAHIPVQECYALWLNRNSLEPTGSKHDSVCSGELNSGLFADALERGDVKAMVFGHDHYNDYAADYCGIRLCYSSTVSELGRYTPDVEPVSDWENTLAGARVLRLYQDGSFDTYISYLKNADWTIIGLDVPESIPLGSELTYRAVIGGRGEGLKYNYVWRFGEDWQYWSSTVKETGEMTSEDSFTFTPDRIGVYSLWVDVQDAAGHRATSHTASLQVLRPDAFAWSLQGVSAPESIELGHTLTFSAIVEGTPKDASFNYAWSWEGNWGDDWDSTVKSTGEMTQDTSFTFTPRKLGTYYLWVDVKDAFGESATSEQLAVQVLAKQCPWKRTGVQVSTSGFVGNPVSFSAILEGETDGLRFNYAWSEGRGWSNWGSTKKD
ncbi:MAG: metallophosphoesterase, partial [Coriobacteriales bacterium]|nr:metallophosphoesterase [Coriobacteriales bacterium]